MCKEHHRQTLSWALRMPEHSNLTITLHSLASPVHSFIHCEILMVSRHNLLCFSFVMIKTYKVLDYVEKTFFSEYATEKDAIVGQHWWQIISIIAFPFHIAIFIGSDCTSPCLSHVANHVERIIVEQTWNGKLIIPYLQISVVNVSIFTASPLQFNHH